MGRAQLITGLTLVVSKHVLVLQVQGQDVPVALLVHVDPHHVIVQGQAVPGPDHLSTGR